MNPQPPVEVKQIQDKPPEKPAEKVPEKPPEVKKDNTKTTGILNDDIQEWMLSFVLKRKHLCIVEHCTFVTR